MATRHIHGAEVGKEIAAFGPAIAACGKNSGFMSDVGVMMSSVASAGADHHARGPSHGLKCSL